MEKSVVIWLLCDVDRSRFAIHHSACCSACHISGYSPQTTDELSGEEIDLPVSFLFVSKKSVLFQKMMMTVVPLYKVKPSLWLFV